MKNYLIFIVKLFLISFLSLQANAKTLPPGTGGAADVPANVLILLDASGSMGWNTTVGINYDRPRAVVPIPNTNSVITYSNDSTVRKSGHTDNVEERLHISRTTLRNFSSTCRTHNIQKNIVYFEQKIYFMSVDQNRYIYRYDTVTNQCSRLLTLNSQDRLQAEKLLLHNDHLIAISGRNQKIIKVNLRNNVVTNCNVPNPSHLRTTMSNSSNPWDHSNAQFTIDSDGNLIAFRQFNAGGGTHELFKYAPNGACFSNEPDQTFRGMFQTTSFFQVSGIVAHPTDSNTFFATSWSRSSLAKFTTSGSSISNIEIVGRNGGINSNYNPTNKSSIRFQRPHNISVDSGKSRVYVADYGNRVIQSFDYNLNFQAVSGFRSTQTRMKGAQDAIQSLVTDSALISSVNFGFGIWSDYQVWISSRPFSQFGISSVRCRDAVNNYGMEWLRNYWWWTSWHCVLYGGVNNKSPDVLPGYDGWDNGRNQGIPCSAVHCHEVKIGRDGAELTGVEVKKVRPMWGTNARFFAMMAKDYYDHPDDSPIDPNSDCQASHVIVIGDGDFTSGQAQGLSIIKDLAERSEKKVKTVAIAYGSGISAGGLAAFNQLSVNGGYPNGAIIASGPAQLRARLGDVIRNIQAEKLAFTAPAITATLEDNESANLYQAQFKYRSKREWQGTLSRSRIDSDGKIDESHADNWEAAKKMPAPNSRKIWTPLKLAPYQNNEWNNFVESNSLLINEQFNILGNEVSDYHNDTPTSGLNLGTARCSSAGDSISSIQDGTDDDIKGLISFVRGNDYFDYDSDCILKEKRVTDDNTNGYLGDIYHSEMIVVGPPSADTNYSNEHQEAYFRSLKNYKQFAQVNEGREETIYVGANDGMLHAFKSKDGVERWAFVPPYIAGRLPLVINTSLNDNNSLKNKGGSSAIYGVDGSPVAHDMYIQHPITGTTGWYSIMMVPFGRGGAGFSVLDITDETKPYHLYTIFNDDVNNKILRTDHIGNQFEYEYVDDTYSFLDLGETKTVSENYANDSDVDKTCNASLITACYESNTWTFPIIGVTKDDLEVTINGVKITNFTVNLVSGNTKITFDRSLFYNGDTSGLPGSKMNDTDLEISVSSDAIARLSTSLPAEYNYTKLGETWSSPRIFRMPNDGRGDTNTVDDIYVAVMGAGYGTTSRTKGSSVYVINLADVSAPGKVQKEIIIFDSAGDNITNSVLATPVVVTADQSNTINFRGALVYINDLEGKVTKINLTNMKTDNDEDNPKQVDLYDNTTLFHLRSTDVNGRYMFHGMDAAIGKTSNNFWLFAGTGDYERVTSKESTIDNLMLGIRDKDYPNFKQVSIPFGLNAILACQDTTDDSTGVKCPLITDDQINIRGVGNVKKEYGWYIKLKKAQKVVAEPTVTKGMVYFPVYEPSTSANQCDMGKAFICAVDDECGTNYSSKLGDNEGEDKNAECLYVGKGVLSKIVVFRNTLNANISGESIQEKKDFFTSKIIAGDTSGLRSSWREGNF